MKLFIIILMFISTIYAVSMVTDNGKEQKASLLSYKPITPLSCIAVTIIAVAYDIACLYLLVRVV